MTTTQAAIPQRLQALFEEFDRSRLRWSLLRPRQLLAQPEGDVDILVEPVALDRAARAIREQGFIQMIGAADEHHALDRDADSGRFLWIHVQTRLVLGGMALPASTVLAAADSDPVPQPNPAWLFWILVLHDLLDKRLIPSRHRPHLRELAELAAAAPFRLRSLAQQHALDCDRVLALARAGDWSALEASVNRRATRRRNPLRALARRGRNLAGGRRARPGISVAVLGPDGAGKTTLVNSLHRSLPLPTQIQYLGLTGGRMPWVDALRLPGLVFAARLAILWWRYLRGCYFRRRGRIVLFERYVLDAAVPSGRKLRPIANFSRRLQRWVLPLPDLVLLLDASGSTMHRRSGEYDAARLEQWRAAFRRLERSVKQLEVLDAERPADAVRRDAEQLIWLRYRRRREAAA